MKFIFGKYLVKLQFKQYCFAEGISSLCDDGKHVLFLDFDGFPLSIVEACCGIVQQRFGVGTFYIFRTDKDAYHAMCISKFISREILWMQDFIGIEKNFISLCYRRSHWTLRTSGKGWRPAPKLILILYAPSKRETSEAHAAWLRLHNNIDVKGTDGFKKLTIEKYATFPIHMRQNRNL